MDAIGFIYVQLISMVDSSPEKYLEYSNRGEELGKIDIRILRTKRHETRCDETYEFLTFPVNPLQKMSGSI